MEVAEDQLAEFFSTALPLLDARRRGWSWAPGKDARSRGRDLVSREAAASRNTVITGTRQIASGEAPRPRVRREGAGRRALWTRTPICSWARRPRLARRTERCSVTSSSTSKSTYSVAWALRAKGFRSGRGPSGPSSPRSAMACRRPRSRKRAPSTWTVTPSSTTSTNGHRFHERRPAHDERGHEEERARRRVLQRRQGVPAMPRTTITRCPSAKNKIAHITAKCQMRA